MAGYNVLESKKFFITRPDTESGGNLSAGEDIVRTDNVLDDPRTAESQPEGLQGLINKLNNGSISRNSFELTWLESALNETGIDPDQAKQVSSQILEKIKTDAYSPADRDKISASDMASALVTKLVTTLLNHNSDGGIPAVLGRLSLRVLRTRGEDLSKSVRDAVISFINQRTDIDGQKKKILVGIIESATSSDGNSPLLDISKENRDAVNRAYDRQKAVVMAKLEDENQVFSLQDAVNMFGFTENDTGRRGSAKGTVTELIFRVLLKAKKIVDQDNTSTPAGMDKAVSFVIAKLFPNNQKSNEDVQNIIQKFIASPAFSVSNSRDYTLPSFTLTVQVTGDQTDGQNIQVKLN